MWFAKKKEKDANSLVPFLEIKDNLAVTTNLRVVAALRMYGAEMETVEEGFFEQFNHAFMGAMKQQQPGTEVSFYNIYYYQPFRAPKENKGFFEQSLIDHNYNRLVLFHDAYLVVSIGEEDQKGGDIMNSPLVGTFNSPKMRDSLNSRKALANRAIEDFSIALSKGGIRFERLDDEGLETLMLQYMNLQFDSKPSGLNHAFVPCENGLVLGNKKCNIVTMTRQGDEVFHSTRNSYGVAAPFAWRMTHHLQFPHIYAVTYRIEQKQNVLSSLRVRKKANEALGALSRSENNEQMKEIGALKEVLSQSDRQLYSTAVSVILWESNDALRENQIKAVELAFRETCDTSSFVEGKDTFNLFLSWCPGNAFRVYRRQMMLADHAVVYNNPVTSYTGSTTGEFFTDRFGNPCLIDLYRTDLQSPHAIMIAPTGSGKSYLTGGIIAGRHERGWRQYIVDNGVPGADRSSYQNLVKSLGGLFIQFNQQNPANANPCLLPKDANGNYILDADKRNFLTAFLTMMWKGTSGVMAQHETSELGELVTAYYEHVNRVNAELASGNRTVSDSEVQTEEAGIKPKGRKAKATATGRIVPSIASFYEWIENYRRENANKPAFREQSSLFDFSSFVSVLKPFAIGTYKHLFNSEDENSEWSKYRLICVDISRIQNNPQLFSLVTLVIMEFSLDQMRMFPDAHKAFYVDEGWSVFNTNMGEWINMLYRVLKKFKGVMMSISQSWIEFKKSAAASQILSNANLRFVLGHQTQGETEIQELVSYLGLTPHQYDLLKSLQAYPTRREFLLIMQGRGQVFGFEASPELDAILTTKQEHFSYLKQKLEFYRGNLVHAVKAYAEDKQYKRGIFAS